MEEKKILMEFQIELLKILNIVYSERKAFDMLKKILDFMEEHDYNELQSK